jgi:hypothetical protein
MATAKSDEESDLSSHPLAENRPGVYVQVVAGRRRKKGKRGEASPSSRPPEANARSNARQDAGATAGVRVQEVDGRGQKRPSNRAAAKKGASAIPTSEAIDAAAQPVEPAASEVGSRADAPASTAASPGVVSSEPPPERVADAQPAALEADETEEEDDGRKSGERPVDSESMRAREAASENTNHSAALMGLSIPPPPRLPSFARAERDIDTDPPLHSASLLDAPHSLRPAPESTPAARPSVTLVAFVAVFSAIIVSAGLVALRELASDDSPKSATVTAQQVQAIAPRRDTRPRVEQLVSAPQAVPSVERAQASAQPDAHSARLEAAPPSGRPLAVARPAALRAPVRPVKSSPTKTAAQAVSKGEQQSPEEADQDEDRLPGPDEPLELPVNPY